ncbi:MAG: ATP-binding cassette domain-containing protein [Candidatus Parcubacteria bacterium]|nr:ATP-binding cassette domain-containing protein [Candidatus Parcubacteria bacterium]
MPAIEITNLRKQYNGLVAVDSLNLKINEGEIFGLLGPNGAGKTTTLMMLTTLIKPTSGTAAINGFDIVKNPSEVRKSIGMVFQDPSSDEILTGYENLKLHGMLYGMDGKLREKRIEEILKLVNLEDRKNDFVKKYSGGMRRRLELGRGLIHHPKILFLDEPTLGLDPQARENIWQYVEKLTKEEKITIIITTHYMEEAEKLCDRLAIIDKGKIVALGSPKELKEVIGGDIVTLKIRNPNINGLENLNFIKKIEIKGDILSLVVMNANINLPRILKIAGEVESVEVKSGTLEEVFLKYTGREIKENASGGRWSEKVIQYKSKK